MPALSDYLENALLDHLLGGPDYTPAVTHYIALFTAAPTDAGGGTEVPSSNNYVRAAVTNNTINWPTSSSNSKANANVITFPTSSGSWGTITHFGIFDALSGGNLLAWAALTSSQAVGTGDTPDFAVGALQVSLGGALGNNARNGLLNLAFGGSAYARPSTVYPALYTAPPNAAGGGTQVSGGNYSRPAITNNSTSFPSASSGAKTNGEQITFPVPSSSWGVVTDIGWFDSSAGGNLLIFGSLVASRTVTSGTTFRVGAGQFTLSLD